MKKIKISQSTHIDYFELHYNNPYFKETMEIMNELVPHVSELKVKNNDGRKN